MVKAISYTSATPVVPCSSLVHLWPCASFFRRGDRLEGTHHFIFERCRAHRRLLRIDHDVCLQGTLPQCLVQGGKIHSYRVTHAPLDAIALHRPAKRTSNGKTHLRTFSAAARSSVFGAENIEESHATGKMTSPILIDGFKAGMLQQSRPARETELPRRI